MSDYFFRLLDGLRAHIGWAETGGRIIRDAVSGDVVGRTKWIARSDFWQDRPVKIGEREAHKAIDRAQKGERMTPKQARFVAYARNTVREQFIADRETVLERRAIMREGAGLC